MSLSRRKFLEKGLALSGACLGLTHLPSAASVVVREDAGIKSRHLVIIHLAGGNDALNTVVPFTSDEYYRARPNIAVPANKVLSIDSQLGWHPAMREMSELFQAGKVGIICGVGYPNASKSHVRAEQIWNTAQPDAISDTNWLQQLNSSGTSYKVSRVCSNLMPPHIFGASNQLNSQFQLALGSTSNKESVSLQVQMDGFDTHADQVEQHAALLKDLSRSIGGFQQSLELEHCEDQVLTIVYSEFGRSVRENDDHGTDHGNAGTMFVIGSNVRGGVYGGYSQLEEAKDTALVHTVDFRTVYATLSERWLGCRGESLLGHADQPLTFV